MKGSGDYYVTVIEDTRKNEIIGAATLVIEHKFIHECGLVSNTTRHYERRRSSFWQKFFCSSAYYHRELVWKTSLWMTRTAANNSANCMSKPITFHCDKHHQTHRTVSFPLQNRGDRHSAGQLPGLLQNVAGMQRQSGEILHVTRLCAGTGQWQLNAQSLSVHTQQRFIRTQSILTISNQRYCHIQIQIVKLHQISSNIFVKKEKICYSQSVDHHSIFVYIIFQCFFDHFVFVFDSRFHSLYL